jgi:hypothetical protein
MTYLPIPRLALWLMPILQLAPPTKINVALRPAPFPPTLCRILPLFGNNACQQELSLPTLQGNPLTLGNFVPRPTPAPPTPQRMQLTLGDIATRRCWPTLSLARPSCGNVACWACWPMLSPAWPPHGDIAPRSMPFLPTSQQAVLSCGNVVPWPAPSPPMLQCKRPPPGNVAHWPPWPMLSPAWPPPVITICLPLPCVCSIPACIAGRRERPHIAVAAKSGKQAGHGGVDGKATGR